MSAYRAVLIALFVCCASLCALTGLHTAVRACYKSGSASSDSRS